MDARAKDEVREVLIGLLQHPELIEEAIESIADISGRYRIRSREMSATRRRVEAEIRQAGRSPG